MGTTGIYKDRMTDAIKTAYDFMCEHQRPIVNRTFFDYIDTLEELGKTLQKTPKIYAQDGKGYDAIVYAHYFFGDTDVFVTERDGDELFAYTILNGDYEMSELGYQSLSEIKNIAFFQLDFFWEEKTLREALKEVSDYFENI